VQRWGDRALARTKSQCIAICCDAANTCCLHSFDVDYPVEVDDEYWHNPDPSRAFKQPEGKVSLISFFNCHLRLLQILSFALRTIVSRSTVITPFKADLAPHSVRH
jgi:hypothetical protein